MAAEKSYSRVEVGANISRARNSPPQIHVSLVAAYIIYCTSFGKTSLAARLTPKTSLASQTQPTPRWVAFSITHGDAESNLRWGWLGLTCKTTPKT